MTRPFTWIASAIFALMAIAHIYRLITHFQIIIGSHMLPMWVSIAAIIVCAVLSWMLCREARGTRGP